MIVRLTGLGCRRRLVHRPSVFVSGSSGLLEQVKGWRHFTIADGVVAGHAGAVSARPQGPRSLVAPEGESRRPRIPGSRARGPRTRGKRQADRSDVRQEFARLNKSPIAFRAQWTSGRAQPFMPQEYLTIPVFELYPFGCADFEADAAAFKSGAVRAPFIQRLDLTLPRLLFPVKKMQQNIFSESRRRPHSAHGQGSRCPSLSPVNNRERQDSLIRTKGSLPDSDGPEPPSLDRRAYSSAAAADPFRKSASVRTGIRPVRREATGAP